MPNLSTRNGLHYIKKEGKRWLKIIHFHQCTYQVWPSVERPSLSVKDGGLVILTACGDAGVIKTNKDAKKVAGIEKAYAIVGGFELSGKNMPRYNRSSSRGTYQE
jgi:hypothetical protein